MTEAFHLVLATVAGMLLGAFFFGGLWWTVRRALAFDHPAPWFLGSLLLRVGITVSGFYLAGGGHWQRLALCLCGFVAARLVVQRLTPTSTGQRPGQSQAATHAP